MNFKLSLLIFCTHVLITAIYLNAQEQNNVQQMDESVFEVYDNFCYNNPKKPFYQRVSDGIICCRGKQLTQVSIQPDVQGECAISTKVDQNGALNPDNLWCSYTCKLRKMGLIGSDGAVVPEKFLAYLSKGLSKATQDRIKTIMGVHFNCFKPLKNPKFPCYTPLGFHKCFKNSLAFLCTYGMPKNLKTWKKPKLEHENLTPYCYYNKRRVMAGCCHGKPLPWTIREIMESHNNNTVYQKCLQRMGAQCDATCFLYSMGIVNADMELNPDEFEKKMFKYFPAVKASSWMDYLGPTFMFYDEVMVDLGFEEPADPAMRVCTFHDRVLELHESKVEQYCELMKEEVKDLLSP